MIALRRSLITLGLLALFVGVGIYQWNHPDVGPSIIEQRCNFDPACIKKQKEDSEETQRQILQAVINGG